MTRSTIRIHIKVLNADKGLNMLRVVPTATLVVLSTVVLAERTLEAQFRPPEELRWSVTVDDAQSLGTDETNAIRVLRIQGRTNGDIAQELRSLREQLKRRSSR